jgi:hypothetical protein
MREYLVGVDNMHRRHHFNVIWNIRSQIFHPLLTNYQRHAILLM